ncbi:MAG: hypothetical protein JWM11_4462, partial [Planctomycetaceae bacterium]|nr:hypothetical protein [Planctomycetaceae bacterium]
KFDSRSQRGVGFSDADFHVNQNAKTGASDQKLSELPQSLERLATPWRDWRQQSLTEFGYRDDRRRSVKFSERANPGVGTQATSNERLRTVRILTNSATNTVFLRIDSRQRDGQVGNLSYGSIESGFGR